MSSDSDSDEQFESADEDFDFETDDQKHAISQESKDEILPQLADLTMSVPKPPGVHSNDTISRTKSCVIKTQILSKSGENNNSTDKVIPNASHETSSTKSETQPSQSYEDSNVQILVSNKPSSEEKDKVNEVVNMKNSAENKISEGSSVQFENLTTSNIDKRDRSNTSNNPVHAKTITTKVKEPGIGIDCDGWDVGNDDIISEALPKTLCSVNINESKNNNTRSNKSFCGNRGDHSASLFAGHVAPGEDKIQIGNPGSYNEHVKNESLKENVCENTGVDGWDVEVEDGFEIPVDLNKITTHATGASERFPFSLTAPLQKLADVKEDSWGGWGSWGGVGNILSTATSGVTTLTSQVSHGFGQVLGAPDPAELAKLDRELSEQKIQQQHNAPQPAPNMDSVGTQDASSNAGESVEQGTTDTRSGPTGLFSFSQLTRLVETTGSKVIAGGLDTLENLGKKTMEVLQDGDPGLKRKRALLFPNQDKPVLSQVLRDAKGRLESEDNFSEVQERSSSSGPTSTTTKNLHFETLLDDYQGLAHLEALEMLSKQCSVKLHNALMAKSGDEHRSQELNEFQETLQQIREMCQVEDATDPADNTDDEDEDDVMGFGEKVEEIVRLYDLSSKLNCDRLVQVNKKMTLQMDRLPLESSCDVLYAQCLRSMAEFTSVSMEVFHKSASLLLLKSKHRTVDETDALTQFTSLLCSRITALSSAYSQAMVKLDKDTALVTNVYLEAANSCSYLQDASQLLIPVLQIVAIQDAS